MADNIKDEIAENLRPGFYKRKLVRGGVYVPVRIYRVCKCSLGGFREHPWTSLCDRYPHAMKAVINGKESYIDDAVGFGAQSLKPISKAEYDYLLADNLWCEKYAPDDPKARPESKINKNTVKPLF